MTVPEQKSAAHLAFLERCAKMQQEELMELFLQHEPGTPMNWMDLEMLDCLSVIPAAAGVKMYSWPIDLSEIDLRNTQLWWEWPHEEVIRYMDISGLFFGYNYPPEDFKRDELVKAIISGGGVGRNCQFIC